MNEPTHWTRVCGACNSKLTPDGLPLSPERALFMLAMIADISPLAALILLRRSKYPCASINESARHASRAIPRDLTRMKIRRECLAVVKEFPTVAEYLTPEDAKKERRNAEQNRSR